MNAPREIVLNPSNSPRLTAAIENLKSVKGENYAHFAVILLALKQMRYTLEIMGVTETALEQFSRTGANITGFISDLLGQHVEDLPALFDDVDTLESLSVSDGLDIVDGRRPA